MSGTRKPNNVKQHEPLRIPQGFNTEERALVMQIDRMMDDLFATIGRIEKRLSAIEDSEQE